MARNILYLTGTYPQPSETFIEQEIQLLLENGVPIIPVAIFQGGDDGAISDVTYLSRASASSSGNNGSSALRALVKGPIRKMVSLKKHHDKLIALSDIIEVRDVDHIHAAFGGLPALLCAELARKHGIPYSVSVHANDILCSPFDDRMLLKAADQVFFCNHRTLNEVLKRSPWIDSKAVYVPHGLRLSDWPYTPPASFNSPLRFLFVGRLTEKKDPFRSRDLVAALSSYGIPATITFAGDGPLKTTDMTVTGFIPRADVRAEMAKSDILLCTSVEQADGDMEGIPNVILEAMATGLPVIAPLTGGIGEVLNESTGYPFEPADTARFAALVKSILDSPAACVQRCAEARGRVSQGFSAEDAIQKKVRYFSEA